MRPTTILLLFLIPFFSFSQKENYSEFSIESGVKYSFLQQAAKQESKPCSGQQCYHHLDIDNARTTAIQGQLQLTFVYNRLLIPIGLGYLKSTEELAGSEREGILLFGQTYYEHTALKYKSYAEFGSLFTGVGLNLLSHPEKMFLGPITRLNYNILIGGGSIATINESETTTNTQSFSGEATDYLTQATLPKHSVFPSVGLLYRYSTKFGLQFNVETGFEWSNKTSISMERHKPISGGIYFQFNLGFDLNKIVRNSDN